MNAKRRAALALRIIVSMAMLVVLLQGQRANLSFFSSLFPQWDPSALMWLIAGLLATLVAIGLSALRWRQVLAAMGFSTHPRRLLSHELAGLFVSNFVVGTTGGDVLRAWRLSADIGERPASFASVVLERLTGWVILPLITLFALFVNPGLRRLGNASYLAEIIAMGTLMLLGIIVTTATSRRFVDRLAHRPSWQPFISAVQLGIEQFRSRPTAIASVLVVGLAYQLTVMLSAWLASEALGLDLGLTAVLAFIPAVAIAQALPISVGGLGLREGTLVIFLGPLGVPVSQAIALGLLFYGMNLVASLLGAPAFAAGRGRQNSAPATSAA